MKSSPWLASILSLSVFSSHALGYRLQWPIESLPPELVRVEPAFFQRDSLDASPTVYVLQDIHSHREAQEKLSKTLEHLLATHTVTTVAVEGAFEPFDFNPFYFPGHEKITRQIARGFLEKNLISAPSYVGVTQPLSSTRFVGVDDASLYDQNVAALRDGWALREKNRLAWARWKKTLSAKQSSLSNPKLVSALTHAQAYAAGTLSLVDYVALLATFPMELPSSLVRYRQAVSLERALDLKGIHREKEAVFRHLLARLPARERHAVLTAPGSTLQQWASMRQTIKKWGISLDEMPHFAHYLAYIELAEALEPTMLVRDLMEHENRVLASLATSRDERALLQETRHLQLIDKLIDFSLTPEEWKRYRMQPSSPAFLTLRPYEDFYRLADARSAVMATQVAALTKNGPVAVVLGGFHSNDVIDQLSQRGLRTVRATPRLSSAGNGRATEALSEFLVEKSPLELIFEGRPLFLYPSDRHLGTPKGPNTWFVRLQKSLLNGDGRYTLSSQRRWGRIRAGKSVSVGQEVYVPTLSVREIIASIQNRLVSKLRVPGALGIWSRVGAWGYRMTLVGRVEGFVLSTLASLTTYGWFSVLFRPLWHYHNSFTSMGGIAVSFVGSMAFFFVINILPLFVLLIWGHWRTGIVTPTSDVKIISLDEAFLASVSALPSFYGYPFTYIGVFLLSMPDIGATAYWEKVQWLIGMGSLLYGISIGTRAHERMCRLFRERYWEVNEVKPLSEAKLSPEARRELIHDMGIIADYVSTRSYQPTPDQLRNASDADSPTEIGLGAEAFFVLGSHFLDVPRKAADVYELYLAHVNRHPTFLNPFPIPVYFAGGRGGRNLEQEVSEAEIFRGLFRQESMAWRLKKYEDSIEKFGYILSHVFLGRLVRNIPIFFYWVYLRASFLFSQTLYVEPQSDNTGANIKRTEALWLKQNFNPQKIVIMTAPVFQLRARLTWLAQSEHKDSDVHLVNYRLYPFPDFNQVSDEELLDWAAELWYQVNRLGVYWHRDDPFIVSPSDLEKITPHAQKLVKHLYEFRFNFGTVAKGFSALLEKERSAHRPGAMGLWKRFSWGKNIETIGAVEGVLLSLVSLGAIVSLLVLYHNGLSQPLVDSVSRNGFVLFHAMLFAGSFFLSVMVALTLMFVGHLASGIIRPDKTWNSKPDTADAFFSSVVAVEKSLQGFPSIYAGVALIHGAHFHFSAGWGFVMWTVGILLIALGVYRGGERHRHANQRIRDSYAALPTQDIAETFLFSTEDRDRLRRLYTQLAEYVSTRRYNDAHPHITHLSAPLSPPRDIDALVVFGSYSLRTPRDTAQIYEQMLRDRGLRPSLIKPFPIPIYFVGGDDTENPHRRIKEAELYRDLFIEEVRAFRRNAYQHIVLNYIMHKYPFGPFVYRIPTMIHSSYVWLSTQFLGSSHLEKRSTHMGEKVRFTEDLLRKRKGPLKKVMLVMAPEYLLRARQTWLQESRLLKGGEMELVVYEPYALTLDPTVSDAELFRVAFGLWQQIKRLDEFSTVSPERTAPYLVRPEGLEKIQSLQDELGKILAQYRSRLHEAHGVEIRSDSDPGTSVSDIQGAAGFWRFLGLTNSRVIGFIEGVLLVAAQQSYSWGGVMFLGGLLLAHRWSGVMRRDGTVFTNPSWSDALRATVVASLPMLALPLALMDPTGKAAMIVGGWLHAEGNRNESLIARTFGLERLGQKRAVRTTHVFVSNAQTVSDVMEEMLHVNQWPQWQAAAEVQRDCEWIVMGLGDREREVLTQQILARSGWNIHVSHLWTAQEMQHQAAAEARFQAILIKSARTELYLVGASTLPEEVAWAVWRLQQDPNANEALVVRVLKSLLSSRDSIPLAGSILDRKATSAHSTQRAA